VLLYGCESWIISEQLMIKINSFATSCYRALLGVGRLDKVPNDEILHRVGKPPLINAVRRRQLRWLGHVLRRDEREPARIFALYIPEHSKAIQKRIKNTLSPLCVAFMNAYSGMNSMSFGRLSRMDGSSVD
jgi:hypothetical protein